MDHVAAAVAASTRRRILQTLLAAEAPLTQRDLRRELGMGERGAARTQLSRDIAVLEAAQMVVRTDRRRLELSVPEAVERLLLAVADSGAALAEHAAKAARDEARSLRKESLKRHSARAGRHSGA